MLCCIFSIENTKLEHNSLTVNLNYNKTEIKSKLVKSSVMEFRTNLFFFKTYNIFIGLTPGGKKIVVTFKFETEAERIKNVFLLSQKQKLTTKQKAIL